MTLEAVIDQLGAASLVPEVYASWRPLIRDAIARYLQCLPRHRLDEIIQHQMALAPTAPPAERVVALMHDSPLLHKFGQVIARHRALDFEFRRLLQRLESMEPRTPLGEILPMLKSELAGCSAPCHVEVGPMALAEASVAVVLPVEWRDSPDSPPSRGVVKVLKPGIKQRVADDLAALAGVADWLDGRRGGRDIPSVDYGDTFDTVRELLTNEIHCEQEQRNLAAAAEQYRRSTRVRIPALLPFCTPHVTAMERVEGVKVTEAQALSSIRRARLARAIVDSLVSDVVFSTAPQVMFHADPHAGNLFVTPEDRLGILDWSLTGTLGKAERIGMTRIVTSAIVHDATGIGRAVAALATDFPNEPAIRHEVEGALREIRGGMLPGPAWLMRLLDRVASSGGAKFCENLLLFRKAMLTIEGVVGDICPECSLDTLLTSSALQRFAGEWPWRLWAGPATGDFATHLSNAELMGLLACAPSALMRFWVGIWRDRLCLRIDRASA